MLRSQLFVLLQPFRFIFIIAAPIVAEAAKANTSAIAVLFRCVCSSAALTVVIAIAPAPSAVSNLTCEVF